MHERPGQWPMYCEASRYIEPTVGGVVTNPRPVRLSQHLAETINLTGTLFHQRDEAQVRLAIAVEALNNIAAGNVPDEMDEDDSDEWVLWDQNTARTALAWIKGEK